MIELVAFRMTYGRPDAKKATLLVELKLILISIFARLRGTWTTRGYRTSRCRQLARLYVSSESLALPIRIIFRALSAMRCGSGEGSSDGCVPFVSDTAVSVR